MIVRMKKIFIVAESKDIDSALKALGREGVLHIEYENIPIDDNVTKLKKKLEITLRALDIVSEEWVSKKSAAKIPLPEPETIINEILSLAEERESLIENIRRIREDIALWEEWGDFDPGMIKTLEHKGLFVNLAKITRSDLKKLPEGMIIEELFRKGNILYCALISREKISFPFETIEPPQKGLHVMLEELDREQKRLATIEKRLGELSGYRDGLNSYRKRLETLLEFNMALVGAGRFGRVSYIKGYCPWYNVKTIEGLAQKERWAIIVEDPAEDDIVPTLIKNPKWIDIISPIFRIINIIPGYKEMDISFHFLIFFSLFFGMLIGDSGYGIVYIFLTIFLQKRLRHFKDKTPFLLAYLLSICAIVWGLMTGVFFGRHPWLKPLIPYLKEDVNVQSFCFLIGVIQLSIAHAWRVLRKWPSLKALADIGWVLILWPAYFLAKTLILNYPYPIFGIYSFILGAGLVVFFTEPVRNIFRCIASGLGNLLLKLMGSFGDIVSYIRLFAVSAAGVAISDAFNQMAISIGRKSILATLAFFMVLFLGHTLNIIMGILAVLVHGVRLNVLEFSSHLDMEWSGREYIPFRPDII